MSTTISRNFPDTERAMTDRVSAHLEAPPLRLDIGGGIGVGYKWLKEDIALRSVLSQELANEETRMANEQARRQLADTALQQEQDDANALASMQRINELRAKGMSYKESIDLAGTEDPTMWANPVALKMIGESAKWNEEDGAKKLRLAQQQVAQYTADESNMVFGIRKETFASNPGMMDAMRNSVKLAMESGIKSAHLDKIKMELDEVKTYEDLRIAKDNVKRNQDYANQPGGLLARGVLAKVSRDGGIDADMNAVMKQFAGEPKMIEMLMNPGFLNSRVSTPEDKREFAQALSDASDESGTVDPAVKEKARNGLGELLLEYDQSTAAARQHIEQEEMIKNLGADFEVKHKDFQAEVLKIGSDKNLRKSGGPMIFGSLKGYLSQFATRSAGQAETVERYLAEADAAMAEEPSAPEAAAKVQEISSRFIREIQMNRLQEAAARLKADPVASTQAAAATYPPAGTKHTIRGKTYIADGEGRWISEE